MPNYYNVADIIVLCSESETWGLTINEAMNFNIPVIVYQTCGCAYDLVENNLNGFVIPKGNILEMASKIDYLLLNEDIRSNFGNESGRIISKYSFEEIRKGLSLLN